MKHINKKAQAMENIGALGIGIATLTVILAIVFIMMAQIKTTSISQVSANSASLEPVVFTYNTLTALTYSPNSMELSCSAVYNNITGLASSLIASPNYTCSTSGITMTNTSIAVNGTYAVSYSYKTASSAYNSTRTLVGAAATIPGWIALVVLVSIGGIILGLVSMFRRH